MANSNTNTNYLVPPDAFAIVDDDDPHMNARNVADGSYSMDSLADDPPRVYLVNTSTSDELEAQYNPTELEETFGAEYARQKVVGLSYEVMQFVNTKNYAPKITLVFSSMAGVQQHERNKQARRFLAAATYPRARPNTMSAAGPPRILFVWPSLISIVCVITECKFKSTRFNKRMEPVEMAAEVTIEEIRDVLETSEEVFARGFIKDNNAG